MAQIQMLKPSRITQLLLWLLLMVTSKRKNSEINFNLCFGIFIHSGHQEVVKLLLENGANINANNKHMDTALLLAVFTGNFHLKMIVHQL